MKKHKKKIIIAAAVLLAVVLALAGYFMFRGLDKADGEEQTSGLLLDKETDTASDYSVEIVSLDMIEYDNIKNWVAKSIEKVPPEGKPVFYTLYDNGSETLDMYIFMPAADEIIGDVNLSNMKIEKDGNEFVLHIGTDNKTTHTKSSTELILHIRTDLAGSSEIRSNRLFVNGESYVRSDATFVPRFK